MKYQRSRTQSKNILRTLGKLKDPRSIVPLLNNLNSSYFVVRRSAVEALMEMEEDVTDGLSQVLGICCTSVEPLVEYFRCISGEHPDWDEYRAAMLRQGKSILRVTPRRWGPVATGGFPARLAEGAG